MSALLGLEMSGKKGGRGGGGAKLEVYEKPSGSAGVITAFRPEVDDFIPSDDALAYVRLPFQEPRAFEWAGTRNGP